MLENFLKSFFIIYDISSFYNSLNMAIMVQNLVILILGVINLINSSMNFKGFISISLVILISFLMFFSRKKSVITYNKIIVFFFFFLTFTLMHIIYQFHDDLKEINEIFYVLCWCLNFILIVLLRPTLKFYLFFGAVHFYYFLTNFMINVANVYSIICLAILLLIYFVEIYMQEIITLQFIQKMDEKIHNYEQISQILTGIKGKLIFILNFEKNKINFINAEAETRLKNHKTSLDYQENEMEVHTKFSERKLSSEIDYFHSFNKFSNDLILESRNITFDKYLKENMINILKENSFYELINLSEKSHNFFKCEISPILWSNSINLLIILNENTIERQNEDLKKLDNYKNNLLGTVTHDLRSPLNGIQGLLELLSLDVILDKNKEKIDLAQKSCKMMSLMINDILDYVQILNFKLKINLEQINLEKLLQECINLFDYQARKKGLELIYETQKKEIFAYADPNRLKQIIFNLLSNALKFTKQGYIKIIVEECYDNKYKIIVEDSGIGIEKENLSKLFSIFGKLEQKEKSINPNGIGLGLHISQNLAKELYKGPDSGINIESSLEKGTKFSFFIEGTEKEEDFSNQEIICINKPYYLEQKSHKKKKILIVEDDLINIMIVKKYLDYYNLDYDLAMNGLESVNLIEKNILMNNSLGFAAILMDCNMPIMDGFKATKEILDLKNKFNINEEVFILGLTGNSHESEISRCFDVGMKQILIKPVARIEIGSILKKLKII